MRTWFRFEATADAPKVADVYIYDFIGDWIDDYWGFGVTAKSFLAELAKLPEAVETIRVHVNSPGGDVFSAVAIANMLRQHKATVEMLIEGLAASAATIITSAGDTIAMADNALVMIHNPWTIAAGMAKDLRQTADELDKVRAAIVATYRWHSKLPEAELVALMDATTWMDAAEALEKGFATEIVQGLKAAALLDARAIAKLTVPAKYQARVAALASATRAAEEETVEPDEDGNCPEGYEKGEDGQCHLKSSEDRAQARRAAKPAAADPAVILQECKAAGVLDLAEQLVQSKVTLEAARPRIAAAKEIRGLCELAKMPELAAGYIAARVPVATVKDQLTTITAKRGSAEIDPSLSPNGGAKPRLNTTAIYAERNTQQLASKGA